MIRFKPRQAGLASCSVASQLYNATIARSQIGNKKIADFGQIIFVEVNQNISQVNRNRNEMQEKKKENQDEKERKRIKRKNKRRKKRKKIKWRKEKKQLASQLASQDKRNKIQMEKAK